MPGVFTLSRAAGSPQPSPPPPPLSPRPLQMTKEKFASEPNWRQKRLLGTVFPGPTPPATAASGGATSPAAAASPAAAPAPAPAPATAPAPAAAPTVASPAASTRPAVAAPAVARPAAPAVKSPAATPAAAASAVATAPAPAPAAAPAASSPAATAGAAASTDAGGPPTEFYSLEALQKHDSLPAGVDRNRREVRGPRLGPCSRLAGEGVGEERAQVRLGACLGPIAFPCAHPTLVRLTGVLV
jgi:hypothetical protein